MGFAEDGIVRNFGSVDSTITAGGNDICTVPLDQKLVGVLVAIRNTGAVNPLTAQVTPSEGGVEQTVALPATVTVAAGGLGYVALPAQFGLPVPDAIRVSATSAAGTTARVRVKAFPVNRF